TATSAFFTLSLHDALPIFLSDEVLRAFIVNWGVLRIELMNRHIVERRDNGYVLHDLIAGAVYDSMSFDERRQHHARAAEFFDTRSEEHTSELQSRENLVCR